jgi:hypothetical protein
MDRASLMCWCRKSVDAERVSIVALTFAAIKRKQASALELKIRARNISRSAFAGGLCSSCICVLILILKPYAAFND